MGQADYVVWEAFYVSCQDRLSLSSAEYQNNPNLGGACGEIHAMINKGKKLLNPLGKLLVIGIR